uniref:(northern house mosquito) hypothetical protein n=1 Tax=Culex pipiens TaxID=7175 RepID=A0A8D8CVE9_CULPI
MSLFLKESLNSFDTLLNCSKLGASTLELHRSLLLLADVLRRGRLVELLLAKLAHDRRLVDSLMLLQMFHRTERLLTLRTLEEVGDVERRRQNLDAQPFAAFGRRRRHRSVLLAGLAATACRRFRQSTPRRNRRREVALEQ